MCEIWTFARIVFPKGLPLKVWDMLGLSVLQCFYGPRWQPSFGNVFAMVAKLSLSVHGAIIALWAHVGTSVLANLSIHVAGQLS